MDMTGQYRIPAPRERVWAALNDPATLQATASQSISSDVAVPTT